jgi:hypothetical protein
VAVVLLVLAGAEVGMRLSEQFLSRDVKHIREIPAISQNLADGKGRRILFIGNSLVRAGINPGVIEEELEARGVSPVHIERVFPDSTSLPDWYRVFKHYFVGPSQLPEVLVLCFSDIALQDNSGVDPARLGHYYSSPGELPEIMDQDVHDFDSRAELVLSSLSYSFADRMRVRTRALDALVPEYHDSAQRINRDMKRESSAKLGLKTYQRLSRFLTVAKGEGVHVIVVAMPLPLVYSLDPQIKSVVENAGMSFLDCRMASGISAASFADEMHLATTGASVYSHFLGRELAGSIGKGASRDHLTSSER